MKAYTKLLLIVLATFVFALAAAAQDNRQPDGQPTRSARPDGDQRHDERADILHQLGLSQDQIDQIRRVNSERRPLINEAQKRFRAANRALDEAIYAYQVNEADVQARIKDVQLAQAELAKMRYMNELAIRRILTPEQLVRFRELRQKFEQERENFEHRRQFGRPAQQNARPDQPKPN